MRFEHFEDKRQLKTKAIENVLLSQQKNTQEGQIAQVLMEEAKRASVSK